MVKFLNGVHFYHEWQVTLHYGRKFPLFLEDNVYISKILCIFNEICMHQTIWKLSHCNKGVIACSDLKERKMFAVLMKFITLFDQITRNNKLNKHY